MKLKIDGTILCKSLPLCCVSCRSCPVLQIKFVKEQKQLYVPAAVALVPFAVFSSIQNIFLCFAKFLSQTAIMPLNVIHGFIFIM